MRANSAARIVFPTSTGVTALAGSIESLLFRNHHLSIIAHKETHIEGCGIMGCTTSSGARDDASWLTSRIEGSMFRASRLSSRTPGSPLSRVKIKLPLQLALKISAICSVLPPSGIVDQQPCVGVINHNVEVAGKRADRYDFTWPTGNKTIIIRDGEAFSINGKSARVVADDKFSFGVINTESRSRFCFKM